MPPVTERTPVSFADPLPDEADVVIIGAGIVGTATAYFLAARGAKVVLCEKGRVAGEQSSRNWGWVRQQGRDAAELPIMIEANRIWCGLAERTGEADLAFTQAGCVYLAETEAGRKKYEDWYDLAVQHQLGTRMLTPAEIAARFPNLRGAFKAGMETPTDGRAEPSEAVPALTRAAQRLGAVVIENCAVRTVDIAGGRVAGVVTEKGRLRAARVLLAGGAWSTCFAGNLGIDLPQLSVRSTVARTGPAPDLFGPNISTPGFTLRRRADGGYTVATGDLTEHYLSPKSFRYFAKYLKLMRLSRRDLRIWPMAPKGFPGAWGSPSRWNADEVSPFERTRVLDPKPSPTIVRRLEKRLPQRFPDLAGVKLAEAWAGMIDVTPDAVPTLGEAPELPGLYLATGFSGHGFGIGPAIGRIMADLLTGGDPGHDLSRFRPGRFSDGSEIVPGPY
ncbi:MAG TPA: FAD-binding oxidoreductase [Thermohalobaculum sp.]|nr:FAD-binding oxidoreductase [Thermohalobaculum sp.]